jgi:hypothetical protein
VIKATSSKFGGEVPKIQGSYNYLGLFCMDYNRERLYWTTLSNSVIRDGKVVCFDHKYGDIINRRLELCLLL